MISQSVPALQTNIPAGYLRSLEVTHRGISPKVYRGSKQLACLMNNGAPGASFERFYLFANPNGTPSSWRAHEKLPIQSFCGVWGGFFSKSAPTYSPANLIGMLSSWLRHEKIPVQSFLRGLGNFFSKKFPNVLPPASLIGTVSSWLHYEKPPYQKFFGGFRTLFFKKGS